MSKFPWGKVVDYCSINLFGKDWEIIEYKPWVYVDGRRTNDLDSNSTWLIEEFNSSYNTKEQAVVAILCNKNYDSRSSGGNSVALAVCTMLGID